MTAPIRPVYANVVATPITDEMPVVLDATELCVLTTPCLEWTPAVVSGAVAQVAIPHHRMLRAFIARCSIATDPASLAMARATSLFLFILNGAAWTRILTELRDSGLFTRIYAKARDLATAISDLVLQNPTLLVLLAEDVIAGEPFDSPPWEAAVGRGQGRGSGASAIRVPAVVSGGGFGPPELRFIHLATLDKLVYLTDDAPMTAVAILAGSLGPCFTRAIRGNDLSTVRTISATLRALLAHDLDSFTAAGPSADPLLALQLGRFAISAQRSLGEENGIQMGVAMDGQLMMDLLPHSALSQPVTTKVLAVPITHEMPVVLDVGELCVLATPCLEWTPVAVAGAVTQVAIPHWRMLRVFISRCSISDDPVSLETSGVTSIFLLILSGAAWTRILTELRDSGLFVRTYYRIRDLTVAILDLVLRNPELLVLRAADIIAGEPLASLPPAMAVGQARGHVYDDTAVVTPMGAPVSEGVPSELRFINLATLDILVEPFNRAPMTAVALLAGFLGPCFTNAVRSNEQSTVRIVAVLLRAHLARDLDATAAIGAIADRLLALRVKDFVLAAHRSLNEVFSAATLNEFAIRSERTSSCGALLTPSDNYLSEEGLKRTASEMQIEPSLGDR